MNRCNGRISEIHHRLHRRQVQNPENRDVIEFIRRTNPYAHSDVGDFLIRCARTLEGVSYYSPSFASCFYVFLHTKTNRIFAMAFGQRGLAFRLPHTRIPEALSDRGVSTPDIGEDWVQFNPWEVDEPTSTTVSHIQRWCEIAAWQK